MNKIGTDFCEDLENNRLASAYRAMSARFKMKTERMAFETMIAGHPAIRNLLAVERKDKVRGTPDRSRWEYYLTAVERAAPDGRNKVNFAFIIVRENGELRIDELEITADSEQAQKK